MSYTDAELIECIASELDATSMERLLAQRLITKTRELEYAREYFVQSYAALYRARQSSDKNWRIK